MKIIVMGDTHHRNLWESIIEKEKDALDVVVFNGDFFDSRDRISVSEGIYNFNKIVDFKKAEDAKGEDGIKVILNIGNHDFYYFTGVSKIDTIWNYSLEERNRINECIEFARPLMQMAYAIDENTLVTHAGVSAIWLENNKIDSTLNAVELAKAINSLWLENPKVFDFTPGKNNDSSGDDETQTPIWIRPDSLTRCAPAGMDLIVGHTTQYDGIKGWETATKGLIILCDTIGTTKEYVKILDNVLEPTKL